MSWCLKSCLLGSLWHFISVQESAISQCCIMQSIASGPSSQFDQPIFKYIHALKHHCPQPGALLRFLPPHWKHFTFLPPNWEHLALNLEHFYMFCPKIEGTFYVIEGTLVWRGRHGPLGLPLGSAPARAFYLFSLSCQVSSFEKHFSREDSNWLLSWCPDFFLINSKIIFQVYLTTVYNVPG